MGNKAKVLRGSKKLEELGIELCNKIGNKDLDIKDQEEDRIKEIEINNIIYLFEYEDEYWYDDDEGDMDNDEIEGYKIFQVIIKDGEKLNLFLKQGMRKIRYREYYYYKPRVIYRTRSSTDEWNTKYFK